MENGFYAMTEEYSYDKDHDATRGCSVQGTPMVLVHRKEKDRFDNDVSILMLPNGFNYRMVHHTPSYKLRQRATIYRGRGKFIRVFWHQPEKDTQMTTMEIAGYELCWGDGDPGSTTLSEKHDAMRDEELRKMLSGIVEDDFVKVIFTVVDYIHDRPEMWSEKAVMAR